MQCNGTPECNGHGECNINTGTCICDPGYSGTECNQIITSRSISEFNCDACKENEICDTATGVCICAVGYFGDNCQSK